jgi:drug/metabolite transporter (DMT)-like permease
MTRVFPIPVLCLVLASALWGLSFPVVKALHLEQSARIPGVSSEFLAAWMQVGRFGLGALILLPFFLKRRRPSAPELRQGFWLAVWGGAGMALQADGLAHTAASTSAFLTQAYCVILPMIACLRLRRKPESRTIIATILVMAGCAVLSGMKPGDLRMGRGELETLAAAFVFTFQILTLEKPEYRTNRGLTVTFVMCVGIALLMLPLAALTAPAPSALWEAGASWQSFGLVGVLAVFCSVGAFLLMNHWQPRISATEAGLIYTMEPVFTGIYVMFLPQWLAAFSGGGYPNEVPGTPMILGGGLILAANILMQLKQKPHRPAIAPAP